MHRTKENLQEEDRILCRYYESYSFFSCPYIPMRADIEKDVNWPRIHSYHTIIEQPCPEAANLQRSNTLRLSQPAAPNPPAIILRERPIHVLAHP